MNLDYLRYFVKLAEVRHYTRAAEQLCITQPSLSHAIHLLEAELGVPLFEKTGRNTELTRFGEEFLDCSRRTLETLDQGVESLQRSARGEGLIRLGLLRVLGTEFVPGLAAEFLAQHPGKHIEFSFHTDRTQGLVEGLIRQSYDLIFCSRPSPEQKLTAVPVTSQDLVLIVPRGHPLAGQHSVDLAQTLPYPQICFSRGSGLRDVVDTLFEAAGGAPQIAYETEEDQVIAGLVAQGFGIAVVPYMDLLLKLDLSILQISAPPYKREFFLVSNEQAFLPPAAEHFRAFVLERCRMTSTDYGENISDDRKNT